MRERRGREGGKEGEGGRKGGKGVYRGMVERCERRNRKMIVVRGPS